MNFDEQWVSNGIGVMLILGGLLFLFKYFWPWWTDTYFPARHARDREQYDQLVGLNDRLMGDLEIEARKLSHGLESKTGVIIQGLSNVADGQSHTQSQLRNVQEQIDEITDQMRRFDDILTQIGVAYLKDRLKEKQDEPRTTDEHRADAD